MGIISMWVIFEAGKVAEVTQKECLDEEES